MIQRKRRSRPWRSTRYAACQLSTNTSLSASSRRQMWLDHCPTTSLDRFWRRSQSTEPYAVGVKRPGCDLLLDHELVIVVGIRPTQPSTMAFLLHYSA